MFDPEVFEDVFGPGEDLEYDSKIVRKIRENRTNLEGELFIDKLLKALGLSKGSKHYPPLSHADLRALYKDIVSTSAPDHHKCSILYYLIKDLVTKHNTSSHIPSPSASGSYLPPRYKTFIDGIWLLDRLRLEKALDYLTEPALTPTFPDEILYTLCKHAAPHPENENNESISTLPIAYYQTASPPLASPKVLETYFRTVARVSVTEAFFFSRAQGTSRHKTLFPKLIEFVAGQPSGEGKAQQGVELVNLPLDETEEEWFTEVLKSANQNKMKGAADMLVMRQIAQGKTKELGDLVAMTGNKKIEGVNWQGLVNNLQLATG